MKNLLFCFLLSFALLARVEIVLNKSILNASQIPFLTHTGKTDSLSNVLALNVEYSQVRAIRTQIAEQIGRELLYFTGWQAEGEAHVTTITPIEFRDHLRPFITMERINEIADQERIQESDLVILGLGSGEKKIDGEAHNTFFLIVDSLNLRKIRLKIYQEFVKNGGRADAFDPTWFFPHITIGFTYKDIHESDGLYKDLKHSYDKRFKVVIQE